MEKGWICKQIACAVSLVAAMALVGCATTSGPAQGRIGARESLNSQGEVEKPVVSEKQKEKQKRRKMTREEHRELVEKYKSIGGFISVGDSTRLQ